MLCGVKYSVPLLSKDPLQKSQVVWYVFPPLNN